MIEDQEGSLWVGYRGHGLARLHRSLFSVFDSANGLPTSGATTVFQGRDGTVLDRLRHVIDRLARAAVRTYGVESASPDRLFPLCGRRRFEALGWDRRRAVPIGRASPLPGSAVSGPVRACAGSSCPRHPHPRSVPGRAIRDACRHECRRRRPRECRRCGRRHRRCAGSRVRAVLRDESGRLWVGTRNRGLLAIDGWSVTAFPTRDGLPHDSVQSLFWIAAAVLWIVTRRVLAWLRDGSLSR